MKKRAGGVSGAVAVVLTWVIVWAMPGGAIEALDNVGAPVPGTDRIDMWPQTLAIPGFVGGLVFLVAVAVAGRLRALERASLGLLAGLGVLVGLAVGGIFMAAGWVGGESAPWELAFATAMSVLSAVATGVLFRFLARKQASTGPGA